VRLSGYFPSTQEALGSIFSTTNPEKNSDFGNHRKYSQPTTVGCDDREGLLLPAQGEEAGAGCLVWELPLCQASSGVTATTPERTVEHVGHHPMAEGGIGECMAQDAGVHVLWGRPCFALESLLTGVSPDPFQWHSLPQTWPRPSRSNPPTTMHSATLEPAVLRWPVLSFSEDYALKAPKHHSTGAVASEDRFHLLQSLATLP
jgi:hypothetical protein